MRRTLLLGLIAISVGLLSACGSSDTAAPGPTSPTPPTAPSNPTSTPTSTSTETPSEEVRLPPLPEVAQANETITKAPPPPPAGVPCEGDVDACIDLSANQSWLLRDGAVSYGPVPITHGRAGFRTPPGTFSVGWKDIDHKSSIYDDAPMPYSVFFNGGIAFHQGSLTQESHGCIHLSRAAAEAYYNALAVGATVQVVQ